MVDVGGEDEDGTCCDVGYLQLLMCVVDVCCERGCYNRWRWRDLAVQCDSLRSMHALAACRCARCVVLLTQCLRRSRE